MSLQTVNNGTFDNDPAGEKIRLAFQKVKEMFIEVYGKLPIDGAQLTGKQGKIMVVKATEDGFELVNIAGGGDMLITNALSELIATAATARTNLGLGTAATQATSAFATSAQGGKADTALQSVVAGTGITIDVTDPINPIITNNETNDYVTSAAFAPSTGVLTLTLLGAGTVTVDLSKYTVLKIDGFQVKKGVGNTVYTAIEVGDFYWGWASTTRYVNGKCTALPYGTVGNTSYVIDNEI